MIAEKQTVYGTAFLEHVSKDLKAEFPEMNGFSVTNLKYCKSFYNYVTIRPQVGDDLKWDLICKLPWGHIKLLIDKIKNTTESYFYIQETIANSWSREVLALQIKTDLYKRQGSSVTNFHKHLGRTFF